MKKSDLKTGMRVMTNEGNLYLVLRDCETEYYGHQDLFFANFKGGFLTGSEYSEDLQSTKYDHYDICAVYTASDTYNKGNGAFCGGNILNPKSLQLIWEREKPREMQLSEIEKLLGFKIKVVE